MTNQTGDYGALLANTQIGLPAQQSQSCNWQWQYYPYPTTYCAGPHVLLSEEEQLLLSLVRRDERIRSRILKMALAEALKVLDESQR